MRAAGVSSGTTTPSPQVQAAQALRDSLGLRSDLAFVTISETAVNQPASGFVRSELIGIPVTSSEEAELIRRDTIAQALPAINARFANQPGYIQAWLNQAGGGTADVSVTAAFSTPSSELQAMLPAGTTLNVHVFPYSRAELDSVVQRLNKDAFTLRGEGIHIEHWGLEVQTGQVQVGLNPVTSVASAAATLRANYGGGMLDIVPSTPAAGAASRTAITGRVYGGAYIAFASSQEHCTAANSSIGQFGYFVISAGHCGNGNNVVRGSFSGPSIGTALTNGYYGNVNSTTNCDCLAAGPIPSSLATNEVIIPTFPGLYSYTRLPSYLEFPVGETVCATGDQWAVTHNGDLSCGQITSASTSVFISDIYGNDDELQDAFSFAAGSEGGDSGSPIGHGSTFMGILDTQPVSGSVYASKSYYIQGATGTQPIFNNP